MADKIDREANSTFPLSTIGGTVARPGRAQNTRGGQQGSRYSEIAIVMTGSPGLPLNANQRPLYLFQRRSFSRSMSDIAAQQHMRTHADQIDSIVDPARADHLGQVDRRLDRVRGQIVVDPKR